LPQAQITPNGAIVFALILIGATMAAAEHGLSIVAVLAIVFATFEVHEGAVTALKRSLVLVLPLMTFMLLVWVIIVGRAPADIAAGVVGSRSTALLYVAVICTRLFLIVFVIQSIVACFANSTPLRFVGALRIPMTVKRLLVFTLSLVETFRHAIDRAHTALIACGLISRRRSIRNFVNSWVLVQTVWLTAITIVLGRLRDKWPIENTLGLLDHALQPPARSLSRKDLVWLPIAVVATIAAVVVR
jgi:hypothetical protein